MWLLPLALFVFGCRTNTAVEGAVNAATTEPDIKTVLTNEVSADVVDLSDRFDSICGLVMTQDGVLVAAGEKNSVPYVSLMDTDGTERHGFVPKLPEALSDEPAGASELSEDVNTFVSLCENVESGFTLCYSSVLAVYDSRGNLTDTVATGKLSEYLHPSRLISDINELDNALDLSLSCAGPFHLGDKSYLFWIDNKLWLCDKNGSGLWIEKPQGISFSAFVHGRGDTVYAVVNTENGQQLHAMDIENLAFDTTAMSLDLPNVMNISYSGNMEELTLCGYNGVYAVDHMKKTTTLLFRWSQTNVSGAIHSLIKLDAASLICVPRNDSVLYRYCLERETIKKKIITVGFIWEPFWLNEYISFFSSRYPEFEIKTKEYDYQNQNLLHADFAAGTVPDVLLIPGMELPLTDTLFTDLLPFLDEDETLSRDDFIECIFDQMLIDGRMLIAFDSFEYLGIAAREADVGDKMTWTIDDIQRLLHERPDCYSFSTLMGGGKEYLPSWICRASLGAFINFDKMTCDFENEEFYALLSFCTEAMNRFAPEGTDTFDRNVLLELYSISNTESINALAINYPNEQMRLIGFPNENGKNGAFICPYMQRIIAAIPQTTTNKKAAWHFIRGLYDAEWQNRTLSGEIDFTGFPVMEASMNFQREKILSHSSTVITQERFDDYLSQILKADYFYFENFSIIHIIQEEMMPYLEGQKTAEEVAAIIQSRVSLYLAEQK
ncbi:MAG: hypothetical protein IJR00_04130 [Lachnospiraceae bacterium]|nr:hypothetical protein [Lachnospiraceae bacterium]